MMEEMVLEGLGLKHTLLLTEHFYNISAELKSSFNFFLSTFLLKEGKGESWDRSRRQRDNSL